MRRVLLLTVGAALAALAACSPAEPAHDIAYFRDHPTERAAKMTACRNDQGRLAATPNCINALGADSEAESKRFWRQPAPVPRLANPGKL
jgi:hypothetical protein